MSKQIKWGIVLQYSQMAINAIIKLLYIPIMLDILGDTEYGIYNLASSIIGYLGLLSLGFGAAYIKFYSKYKSQEDIEGIKKLNGLYLIVFSIMGLISLVVGLILAFNVSWFFNSAYSANDLYIAKVLMIFCSINLAVSFPYSVFSSYISSQEKFIYQKLVNIITTIISPCVTIFLLFSGYGSIGMVVGTSIITLIAHVINITYCFTKLKMKFAFGKIDFSLLKEIAVFSVFIAINQIIDQLNWQTDKVILGKTINGVAVAVYAIASTINNIFINFSTAISGVFTPKIHRIVSKKEENMTLQFSDLMIKVGRLQFFVIMLVLTGFIFFGKYFISIWAGDDYTISYYIALLLICPETIALIQSLGIEIRRAMNEHKIVSLIMLGMAVLNVVLSVIFVRFWGVLGVAFGTTLSLIFNTIIVNIFYKVKLKLHIGRFWKSILKILPGLILPTALGVLFMIFLPPTSILMFFIQIIIYSLVYSISIFLLGFNKEEKSFVKGIFKKKIKNSTEN